MSSSSELGYRVLARVYRPQRLSDLIGQDATVKTIRNAFDSNRIAHAFLMTGVRGVGKTTIARIIAKGLNCIGPDGNGAPTVEPCGQCDSCMSIADGRHMDVIEVDAASRTGVADVRSIIESVQFRPTSARYKVYIIDEVHMMSVAAFNALLKTLEEPPDHVKFIFATTEVRKIPVTVMSRCQRYDLRRVEPDVMTAHLKEISGKEGADIADDALALITRAAEGSVRDAQSILDQVISRGTGQVTSAQVRGILGLADRSRAMDLFDHVIRGDAASALGEVGAQFTDGADPIAILKEMAEVVHWVSIVKITPDAANDPSVSPDVRDRGKSVADTLSLRVLTRMWQMLLKALDEVSAAPNPRTATEMAIIRMAYAADLPTPHDVIRKLQGEANREDKSAATVSPSSAAPTSGGSGPAARRDNHETDRGQAVRTDGRRPAEQADQEQNTPVGRDQLKDLSDVANVILQRARDIGLATEIEKFVRPVSFQWGLIEIGLDDEAPPNLPNRIVRELQELTGDRWKVVLASDGGGSTIAEVDDRQARELHEQAANHPIVKDIFREFPQARIVSVTARGSRTRQQ